MELVINSAPCELLKAGVEPIARPILMIAFHFPPSLATGARRPFRFAKYLERYGYRTHVVTSVAQGSAAPWKVVMEAPDGVPSKRAAMWSKAAAILQRCLPYNDQLPWVAHAVKAAESLIFQCRPGAVISSSPPVACHLAAWIISRRYGIPWVADFRDPIYGNPSRCRSWGWMWDAPVDRLIISKAAIVVANTDTAADMLIRRYPKFAHKIHLIWNGYDPEQMLEPRPIPQRSYKVLLHAGSLYGQRHPTLLLASLYRLISTGRLDPKRVRLRLVGEFDKQDPWVTQSRLQPLLSAGCIECTDGAVSSAEAARDMAEADYLLLLDLNDRAIGLQVPAKLFEYIQIGRPILAFTAKHSPVQRILAQSAVPHICLHPDSSDDEIDRQLLALFKMPSDPVRPSPWFYKKFDGDAQARTLSAILDSVYQGTHPRRSFK